MGGAHGGGEAARHMEIVRLEESEEMDTRGTNVETTIRVGQPNSREVTALTRMDRGTRVWDESVGRELEIWAWDESVYCRWNRGHGGKGQSLWPRCLTLEDVGELLASYSFGTSQRHGQTGLEAFMWFINLSRTYVHSIILLFIVAIALSLLQPTQLNLRL